MNLKNTLRALGLFCAFSTFFAFAHAADRFGALVDAIAIPAAGEVKTANHWEQLEKIKSVSWQWNADSVKRHGDNLAGRMKGDIDVLAQGEENKVTAIKIIAPGAKPDIKDFGKGMAAKISTTCDGSKKPRVALFQFVKPGKKPLYISYHAVLAKGSAGGTAWSISHLPEDALENMTVNPEKPCKVLVQ